MPTEQELFEAIRKSRDPWAVLPQLANGTGRHASRTADAVAMSLWPSRGMEVHGFEIKVSRSDWQRELSMPEKAESIFAYCDRWFVVVPVGSNIVRDSELPRTWGLCEVNADGELSVTLPAPTLTPQPLDRTFIASVMRSLQKCQAPQSRLDDAKREGYDEGYAAGQRATIATTKDSERWKVDGHKRDLLYLEDRAKQVLSRIREDLKPLRAWEPEEASS